MRFLALLLVILGVIAAGFAVIPWVQFWLVDRKRYHYYYFAPEFVGQSIAIGVAGLLCVSFGVYLAFGPRRS